MQQRADTLRKIEEERQAQNAAHDARMNAESDRRAKDLEDRRLADEDREAKLKARMAAEKAELEERNDRKAAEAARKVEAAADTMRQMAQASHEKYLEKTAAQQKHFADQVRTQTGRPPTHLP